MVDDKKKEEKKDEQKDKGKIEDKGENAGSDDDGDAAAKKRISPMIKDAKETVEKLEKANAEKKALLDREEQLMAEKALGGESNLHVPVKKKKETDEEYAERFDKGEVDPLAEDTAK